MITLSGLYCYYKFYNHVKVIFDQLILKHLCFSVELAEILKQRINLGSDDKALFLKSVHLKLTIWVIVFDFVPFLVTTRT